jgi:hypothetical protein
VLIQTGAEEVLFRGYMQQQLAARFSSPIMWMVLPSAIFAALHYQPEIMGDNTWLMMAAVFVFAVLAADLTAVTGNIGAAWAMHFVNNALAILVVATDGPLSGLALYIAPISPDGRDPPLFYLDIATTVALGGDLGLDIATTVRLRRHGSPADLHSPCSSPRSSVPSQRSGLLPCTSEGGQAMGFGDTDRRREIAIAKLQ